MENLDPPPPIKDGKGEKFWPSHDFILDFGGDGGPTVPLHSVQD